ncbi:hypothetical protein BBO_03359 [Beauveria brongniartii RCEF 3172]|uniref:NAD(P)-binding domain protein n=1 Tax=Beauveria brongniartii RCEF 3172 TaxID=1081107 RepID=A0A167GLR2_9HYPO|nr:hypothetical protein BBO_03359 [Beauveria brongniartii RCEF 3172]
MPEELPSVLIIGAAPGAVGDVTSPYDGVRGLVTAEAASKVVHEQSDAIASLGHPTKLFLIDLESKTRDALHSLLTTNKFDIAVIGSGIRLMPNFLHEFEFVINELAHNGQGVNIFLCATFRDIFETFQRAVA